MMKFIYEHCSRFNYFKIDALMIQEINILILVLKNGHLSLALVLCNFLFFTGYIIIIISACTSSYAGKKILHHRRIRHFSLL